MKHVVAVNEFTDDLASLQKTEVETKKIIEDSKIRKTEFLEKARVDSAELIESAKRGADLLRSKIISDELRDVEAESKALLKQAELQASSFESVDAKRIASRLFSKFFK